MTSRVSGFWQRGLQGFARRSSERLPDEINVRLVGVSAHGRCLPRALTDALRSLLAAERWAGVRGGGGEHAFQY